MPILDIEKLSKKLGGNVVLDELDLAVEQGEIVALLGPSGSGKTTLLRCVSGLETPDAGRITLNDKVVFGGAQGVNVLPERRNLGLVFQSYALWPHRTVAQNVAFGLETRKVKRADIGQRVGAVLDHLELGQLGGRYPGQLSGGQQQRVSLARAFVTDPSLLLLDEPLSNLDAKLRETARAWLREALRESGKTAIFVTHDQVEAMAVADRVAILRGGKLAQYGTPQEVYERPGSLFVADFMGSPNILEAQGVRRGAGGTSVSVHGTPLCGRAVQDPELTGARVVLRPEHLSLAGENVPNSLAAERVSSVFLGPVWEHWLQVGDQRLRFTTAAPLAGERVWLHAPPEQVLIFHP